MATVNDLAKRSLTRIGIRASETALEADEISDYLDMLNDMLSEWESIYGLGFSPVMNVSDEVRIPRGARAAVIDVMAIKMAPEYSRPVSQALAESARSSFNNMLLANVFIGDVDMPDTLPLGSGNQCNDGTDTRFFSLKDKRNF